MFRSLLNSLTTVEIFLIIVGACMVFAVALAVGIRKAVADDEQRKFEDFADGLRVVYELLFALLLAFVIASVLDKFNDAENSVAAEATALSQMSRHADLGMTRLMPTRTSCRRSCESAGGWRASDVARSA